MLRPANLLRTALTLSLAAALSGCASSGTEPQASDPVDGADGSEQTSPTTPQTGDEPVRIGFLGALTGPFVIMGEPARNGMQLAVDELNEAGGIGGRPVELIEADSASNPETGTDEMERMVESDVVAVGGVISSDVGLATSRIAEEAGLPLFLVKAGSDDILTQETRFTFRTCLASAEMHMQALSEYIAEEGYTRVGAIIGDYAWGHSISEGTAKFIGDLPGVEIQEVVAPVSEQDFTTYIRQLTEFDPEIVVASGHPPGVPSILRASQDLGLSVPVVGPSTPRGPVMSAAGDAAIDRHVDFSCADFSSDEYLELASRYQERYGAFMEDDAVAGYAIVSVIADSIEATGGADRTSLADHVRSGNFTPPGYAWDLAWTPWGEFAEAQPLLTVTRADGAPRSFSDAEWWPEVVFQSDVVQPFEPTD